MYQIVSSDGSVLYNSSYPDDYMVIEPKSTVEIGQPGSLQFALVPEHPQYDNVKVMETYVTATKEGTEIFYGRIIDINVDQTTGIKQIECAGALQFLEDGEIPPVQNPNAEQGQDRGVEMSARSFFTMCINAYNSDIGNDSRRNLYVGTIDHSRANEDKVYNIGNYTQVKSALDSNIISEYGGYFRIRKSGNAHYVDWLEDYDEPNASPIKLMQNVVSQENAFSANELVTVLRPVGKDGLTLQEGTVAISSSLVNKYGRIIQTVQFGDAETESELRSRVNSYIDRIGKGPGMTCTVKVIDMHFLDDEYPTIYLGSTYSNISGFEGIDMVVSGMELNFANPAEDSVTLKNEKELCQVQMGGTAGRGTLSQATSTGRGGGGNGGFQNIWQHITETEDTLSLHAKEISINAEHLVETANEFERYSRRTDDAINTIEGTGVLQNNDLITQIAGSFSTRYYVVPQAKREAPGANPNAYHWYVCSPHTVTEDDINSGKEFFSTPTAALTGSALNTKNLTVGQTVYYMHYTNDTSPVSTTVYYTKGLKLNGGTELTLTEDGQELTVAKQIISNIDGIETIEGSALWTMKDDITGVVGEFEIRTDPQTGQRRVVIKSGGGFTILRNNVEYGVYDNYNLTGGIIAGKIVSDNAKIPFNNLNSNVTDYTAMGLFDNNNLTAGVLVTKLNDGTSQTKISGNMVDIQADQVRIGNTTNVQSWMNSTDTWKNSTDETLDTYQGLIADRATIAQLNAQKARIDTITADYIKSTNLGASIASLDSVNVRLLTSERGGISVHSVGTDTFSQGGISCYIPNALCSATVSGRTLTLTDFKGDSVTFTKAVPTLSGAWDGATLTVTAKEGTTEVATWFRTYTATVGAGTAQPPANITKTIDSFDSSHRAYGYVGCGDNGSYTLFNVNATSEYNKAVPSSGVAGPRSSTSSTYSHEFTITKADGTNKVLTIDCGNIYTAAREGYTLGTFTAATVTTQGARNDNVYVQSTGSGTTTYYTAGTAATYYKQVSSGGTLYYRPGQAGTYRQTVSSGGTVYYTAGTAATYYKQVSSGGTVYYTAGSSVTKLGSSVSVYVPSDSGTTYYRAGSSVTKIGTSHKLRYMQVYDKNGTSLGFHYVSYDNGSYIWYSAGDTATTLGSSIKVVSAGRYEAGSSATVIGSSSIRVEGAASVTPISSTSIRLGTAATITPISSTSIRVESAATVTPISSTSLTLKKATYYASGTTTTNTYYTKS